MSTLDNRMNFLRILYCQIKGETWQELMLLTTIRKSLIKLNKRKLEEAQKNKKVDYDKKYQDKQNTIIKITKSI